MTNNIQIRKLNDADVSSVVAVHLSAFSGFFLSSLGDIFLKKYYQAVIQHADSICIGCESNLGDFVGFAIGNRLSKGFHLKILRSNWSMFMIEGLRLMVTNPKAIIRLCRNFSKDSNPSDDGRYAELLSIGVHNTVEGKGVGKELMSQFEKKVASLHAKKICLTTDKYKNERSLSFYYKNGYEVYYEFTAYPNRKMYKLIKNIV